MASWHQFYQKPITASINSAVSNRLAAHFSQEFREHGFALPASARKGTFFEQSLDLRDPEGHELTSKVLAAIDGIEVRKNKRSAVERNRHYTIVRKILANGLRCFFFREPSRVSYLRKADGYHDGPAWLSGRALARTVDLMEKAGLLKLTRGVHGWEGSGGAASTYDVTAPLFGIFQACGVSDSSLTMRLERERLVRLRSSPPERVAIPFTPNWQTEHWTDLLARWNAFIAKQELAVQLPFDEEQAWVADLNRRKDRSGMPYYRPELFQTDLYRLFVNDFDQHGRLYGGWWINAPKSVRRKITINGQPTVELDFSGCAIRMLYHQRALQCPNDPYELKPVSTYERTKRLPQGYYRESLKRLLNALINTGERGRPENIFREHGLPYPPVFKPIEIRRMMEEKHRAISESFRSGAGLYLHRVDSDLALSIISSLQEEGLAALPIHDSFIVAEENASALRKSMIAQYRDRFGCSPVIS